MATTFQAPTTLRMPTSIREAKEVQAGRLIWPVPRELRANDLTIPR